MLQPVDRPNIYCETLGPDQFGIIEKPLTLVEQIYNQVVAAQDRDPGLSCARLGNLRPLARQSAAGAAV